MHLILGSFCKQEKITVSLDKLFMLLEVGYNWQLNLLAENVVKASGAGIILEGEGPSKLNLALCCQGHKPTYP